MKWAISITVCVCLISSALILVRSRHASQTPVPAAAVSPEEVIKMQRMASSGSLTIRFAQTMTSKSLTASAEDAARLIPTFYEAKNWKQVPVAATAPFILITVSPRDDQFLMDAHYVYPINSLSLAIALDANPVLQRMATELRE